MRLEGPCTVWEGVHEVRYRTHGNVLVPDALQLPLAMHVVLAVPQGTCLGELSTESAV
jgi:hypothetical protein